MEVINFKLKRIISHSCEPPGSALSLMFQSCDRCLFISIGYLAKLNLTFCWGSWGNKANKEHYDCLILHILSEFALLLRHLPGISWIQIVSCSDWHWTETRCGQFHIAEIGTRLTEKYFRSVNTKTKWALRSQIDSGGKVIRRERIVSVSSLSSSWWYGIVA